MGSPPLTRERQRWGILRKTESRITPAYAGKTMAHLRAVLR